MGTVSLRRKSALTEILLALIPYSRNNLRLAFKPRSFFARLEKQTHYSQTTLHASYNRGIAKGLINPSKPTLTPEAQKLLKPYTAKYLGKRARLMIVFDVPEARRKHRDYLRNLLRQLEFIQVQKSVWVTDYDHLDTLLETIFELNLHEFVEIFECKKITPKN